MGKSRKKLWESWFPAHWSPFSCCLYQSIIFFRDWINPFRFRIWQKLDSTTGVWVGHLGEPHLSPGPSYWLKRELLTQVKSLRGSRNRSSLGRSIPSLIWEWAEKVLCLETASSRHGDHRGVILTPQGAEEEKWEEKVLDNATEAPSRTSSKTGIFASKSLLLFQPAWLGFNIPETKSIQSRKEGKEVQLGCGKRPH